MPATRDVIRPKPPARRGRDTIDINIASAPPRRAAPRASARDAAADITSKMKTVARDLAVLTETQARTRDTLDRLRPLVDARRAAKARDAAYEARLACSTPASVQAANAARWPRLGV